MGAATEGRVAPVGEFSKQVLNASFFFLFEIYLLCKPATPNKLLASHTAQLSNQTGEYPHQGLSWTNSS